MKLRALSLTLAGLMLMCGVSCGDKKTGNSEAASVEYASAELGKDAVEVKADLQVITHRTDLIDTVFADYISEFQEMYPNVTITYEGVTDYDGDMTTRLTSGDWGDICGIPTTVEKSELGTYFEPISKLSDLENKYEFIDTKAYEGTVYGVPTTGNVQGIVYNKKVWAEAGINELPKTPDEFIDDLTAIKNNTDAIPLYTNYSAGWTLTAWDAYIGGCATGDAGYKNQVLPHTSKK